MPFTTNDVQHSIAVNLENRAKGNLAQNVEDKPLLNALRKNQATHGGGQGLTISKTVKSAGGVPMVGFDSNSDSVSYVNPQNNRRVTYTAKDHVAAIHFSRAEMLQNGIVIEDGGPDGQAKSKSEALRLVNLIEDKNEDLFEGIADSTQKLLWDDGTADPKAMAGIRSIITDVYDTDGTTLLPGTIGGIDQTAVSYWRNHHVPGIAASMTNAEDRTLIKTMNKTYRQMTRFAQGMKPKWIWLAGSAYIEVLEAELESAGHFTQSGFAGKNELSTGDLSFKRNDIVYDGYLDTLGLEKECYVIDLNAIKLSVQEGEDMRIHNPPMPSDKFIYHKAVTLVSGLVCQRRNTSAKFQIA